jgi:hypothetical protein
VQITALQLIGRAFKTLNVFMPGQSIPTPQANDALEFLNMRMGLWAQQALTIPSIAREAFTLTAGKGGPSNPYTIGTGGNFNTTRPSQQSGLVGAGLELNYLTSSPVVEIPRDVITDQGYQLIQIKELANSLFTVVYYNPTFTTGFGTINLWPVPNTTVNRLVLYLQKALDNFADLTTVYNLPPGYDQGIHDQLVLDLATPWGATITDKMERNQLQSFKVITRGNLKMIDLFNDFSNDPRGGYNINTGNL